MRYDLWAYLFAILTGLLTYLFIRFGEWALFLIRTRRRISFLNVDCSIERDESTYPCKLQIDFRNWTNMTILLKVEGFKAFQGIRLDPKAKRDSSSGLVEIKFIEPTTANAQLHTTMNIDSIIRHGESKKVWVPLDPDQTDEFLNNALQTGEIGQLKAEILWFNEKPRRTRYRPIIRRA